MPRKPPAKPELDESKLLEAAEKFSSKQSKLDEPKLFGVTDGKAVGTYLEAQFIEFLAGRYTFASGNAAKGIDLPALSVDIKTTSIRQPQSSSPFKSPRQKIFGLGYSLLVFVYEKTDDHSKTTSLLDILHTVYVHKDRTADFQLTKSLIQILANDGNEEDLVALMQDRMLPADEILLHEIAQELLQRPPIQGYLTISNALQWRLQYKRVIDKAGTIDGIVRIR